MSTDAAKDYRRQAREALEQGNTRQASVYAQLATAAALSAIAEAVWAQHELDLKDKKR